MSCLSRRRGRTRHEMILLTRLRCTPMCSATSCCRRPRRASSAARFLNRFILCAPFFTGCDTLRAHTDVKRRRE